MKKVFIVHGFMGTPNGGWKPWLLSELSKIGIYACSLPMPNPDEPKVEEWIDMIKSVLKKEDECILVGHSLGVPSILRYLESCSSGIKGSVLVAGPYQILKKENSNSKLRKIDNFLEKSFDFEKIKNMCEKFYIIHDKDDEYVPYQNAEFLAEKLSADLITVSKTDHHLSDDCHELPEALDAIKEMIQL